MKVDIKGVIVTNDDKPVYDWCGIESTAPVDIHNALVEADGEDLDVYINSGGGDVFSGSEIYAALRDYGGTVNIHIVGLAASAASVIACAGNSDIVPTAMVMIHNVASGAFGDYHEHAKESDLLQKANEAVAAAYIDKAGISKQKALSLMDKETWLTAAEAVKIGIIDRIADNGQPKLTAAAGGVLSPDAIAKIKAEIKCSTDKNRSGFYNAQKLKLLKLKGAKIYV